MIAALTELAGRFTCPACPSRFGSLQEKKKHLRDEHPRAKRG
jgi:hypothetical protein